MIGDVGRNVFVQPGVAEFMRDRAVPAADIVTPNHFELDHLTGRTTTSLAEALAAVEAFRAMGPRIVLVTSLMTRTNARRRDRSAGLRRHRPLPAAHAEAADLGQRRGRRHRRAVLRALPASGSAAEALSRAASAVFGVLQRTADAGAREILLIEAQDELVKPSRIVLPASLRCGDDERRSFRFERFDLRFAPRPWPFADANRAAIDAHFAAKQKANPALWNGRVLLAHEYGVADGVCRGAFLETDFASFNAWRDWGRPPAGIVNCFAAAVLRSADGAYLLGVMGAHTANAGQIYFPCGTPEPGDVVDGRVDLEHSARHELKDETGLDFEDLRARARLAFGPAGELGDGRQGAQRAPAGRGACATASSAISPRNRSRNCPTSASCGVRPISIR